MPEMTVKNAIEILGDLRTSAETDAAIYCPERAAIALDLAAALRLAVRALEPWRTTMDSAPRDRTPILALIKQDIQGSYLSCYRGRLMVLRWFADEDGWSFPGVGGIPDSWIEKWMEVPE